ncbi:hypothetical protein Tco_1117702 [Tanacetum coccineum]
MGLRWWGWRGVVMCGGAAVAVVWWWGGGCGGDDNDAMVTMMMVVASHLLSAAFSYLLTTFYLLFIAFLYLRTHSHKAKCFLLFSISSINSFPFSSSVNSSLSFDWSLSASNLSASIIACIFPHDSINAMLASSSCFLASFSSSIQSASNLA